MALIACPHTSRCSLPRERALPRVEVFQVARASGKSMLQLPGSIQAITEAPILARADG